MTEIKYNTPKNSSKYSGEYIVFYSEEKNPRVLYHGSIAMDAYKKVEEIKEKTKKTPAIVRIPENENKLVRLCLVR